MNREKKRSTLAAWILGIIVFCLAMGITFSDVYGLDQFEYTCPSNGPGNGGTIIPNMAYHTSGSGWFVQKADSHNDCNPPMPAVPEPITLWLVAVGGGILLAGRRK
jgi:hypothetical protein